jgi:eukaryotic-like serine/threonine-protein kinase
MDPLGRTCDADFAMTTAAQYSELCGLSSGGVGVVSLVLRREGTFERLYARKRLHAHFREDEEFRSMFLDEARIAGLIRHPNVVSVLDVGEDADGPYFVMDYVEGLALSRLVRGTGAPLPIQIALGIAEQAARGLHAAHELCDHDGRPLSVVHRDVSPQNILVGFDGSVRVADFGIAKALGRSTHTNTGVIKGKFGYMSPEQLRFEKVDRRADLFALGVVIYEMLAGARLYRAGEDDEGLRRILNEPAPDIGEARPEAPAAIVALLFRMLAKDPALRPASADEVADALEDARRDAESEEGRVEGLVEFMAQHFAELRESTRQAHAEARRKAEQATRVAPVLERASPRWRTRVLWVASGAIAPAVLAAYLAWPSAPSAIAAKRAPERPPSPLALPPDIEPAIANAPPRAEPEDREETAQVRAPSPRRRRPRAPREASEAPTAIKLLPWGQR